MDLRTRFDSWQCTAPLPTASHREIVREMNLSGCKWDTQMGDIPTLAPFALVLPRSDWLCLAALAEALSREMVALERQLHDRPDLWSRLGLPKQLRQVLNRDEPWTPAAARIVRYDFHPTAKGWQISEVNSDVPGGFNESSTFTRLMAEQNCGCQAADDPMAEFTAALTHSVNGIPRLALLAAPGYTEDWQIISGLDSAFRRHGIEACLARPEQLTWENNRAFIRQAGKLQPIGGIHRFYQGEWLTRLPVEKWRHLLRGGLTPVCNPAIAILSESKRLPLLWPELKTDTPTWQSVLAETRPSTVALRNGLTDWVIKPSYCNTGDTIISRGWQPGSQLFLTAIRSVLNARAWVAQKRFLTLPISTPAGPMYPCLGIYTINGKASGIYGRLSPKPVIDYSARDVAILLRD